MSRSVTREVERFLRGGPNRLNAVPPRSIINIGALPGMVRWEREDDGCFFSLDVPARVETVGSVHVQAAPFLGVLVGATADGETVVDLQGDCLWVNAAFQPVLQASAYPARPLEPKRLTVKVAALQALLLRTIHASARGPDRPHVFGVTFQQDGNDLTAFATDGHRLARHRSDTGATGLDARPALLRAPHAHHLAALIRNLADGPAEAHVWFQSVEGKPTHLFVNWKRRVYIGRLQPVVGVDYDKVLPFGADHILTLNRKTFIRDLREMCRAAGMMKCEGAKLELDPALPKSASWTIVGAGGETTKRLPCTVTPALSSKLQRTLNPLFLVDAVGVCVSEDVELWINSDPADPIMVKDPSDREYMALVMPVRLDGCPIPVM